MEALGTLAATGSEDQHEGGNKGGVVRYMTWYAIRTMPGAQMPQREYHVETTSIGADGKPRGKGYRIVPSLDPRQSAIERSLSVAGFTHYMPAEKRLIRDRRKPDLWKARRIPLLQGYVFVKGPCNLFALQNLAGVAGIVGVAGKPLTIEITDILMLRTKEAAAEADFDRQAINKARNLRRSAKNKGDKKLIALIDSLNLAGTTTVTVDGTLLVA